MGLFRLGEKRLSVTSLSAELSIAEARSLAIAAQLLDKTASSVTARSTLPRRTQAVSKVLEQLGAVQLDTISVLARSHELIPYARCGAVGRDAVESAYWGGGAGNEHPAEPQTFEYWSHAACILPIDMWPSFAMRRRSFHRRGVRWHDVPRNALDGVRQQLLVEGPQTSTDLGGAKKGGQWWDWSDTKIAVEWLLDIGEVVCVRRVGWRRVYDLADRAVPDEYREAKTTWVDVDGVIGPSDSECIRELLQRSVRILGVGTLVDVLDVHRLATKHYSRELIAQELAGLVEQGVVVPARVQGWSGLAYADAEQLGDVSSTRPSRTTLLSPFDSLVWHRGRTSRLFDFDYQLEAYVPAHKRVHGYFTMPVLHGGKLVARVDPKRIKDTLHARQITFETNSRGTVPAASIRGTAAALRDAAAWVGCTNVVLDRVLPTQAHSALASALESD
jgi:uncharacterized protein YcaQ